jgi:hypothetical protein
VIFVVGAQKLVPTLAAAHQRIYRHSLPLEDAREAHNLSASRYLLSQAQARFHDPQLSGAVRRSETGGPGRPVCL